MKDKIIIPPYLIPYFRSNHAGETGAVYIYKAIKIFNNDKKIKSFANEHYLTESRHLELIEKILEPQKRSKLILIWKVAGFFTGLIPSILGKNFIYSTIFYVESFVEKHYEEQIKILHQHQQHKNLKKILIDLMGDEVSHKNESLEYISGLKFYHKFWGKLISSGSSLAVQISKKI